MEQYVIEGQTKLRGVLPVHGAKNAALPILAGTLLVPGVCEIHNCPALSDVAAAAAILQSLGCRVQQEPGVVTVDATTMSGTCISEEMMRTMRSSMLFLPAILSRAGSATVCYPGGCDIGLRPIDLHLSALRLLGARVTEDGCCMHCTAPERLRAFKRLTTMPYPGFPTDSQAVLAAAAATARGTSVICENIFENRFRYTCQLQRFGCDIAVSGKTEVIRGVPTLHGAKAEATDLRGGAALVVAALAAAGISTISEIHHITRGYEDLPTVLTAVGANIKRTNHETKDTRTA